ncbi:MAG: membrane protein insertion efficiency factor YidD [Candidatus Omnitrophica bacterium]|nr:membrane protein insertion efficiency factor YidD [Candidatus Omnitrophota bacterium]MCA9414698.1 membrane protein insertion efficiency factor YidD [Candidatus Omnitrophota bacterium]MCA9431826.1 membrane protein insertion efficiency factor YidD [Candidatus Omnitrophota bacterium]MCA9434375.1 membrane protein insertion efficiency factor YidD [Candidatus Omnitrophota bacterium]MCA9441542.1 membrane protein insertion efficiency factor YidD [Candidatus Omnitrophota bacterium]
MSKFAATLLVAMIRFYREVIPLRLGCCRFRPTCSLYAWQAITVYGPWIGLAKALGRLGRCHPFAEGGYDPV